MSRRGWKAVERSAARLIGGKRYPANTGDRADAISDDGTWISQVKNPSRLSLAQVEALAVEMARLGFQRGKLGCLIVKRSGGRGVETPHLVVVTEHVWREMNGRMPGAVT